ncbi:hypothetical protein SYNTR_0775 [Candidatus Syntrophocurvum alkaliphilum]|uniref:Uncharacterized protein n=1 Tax=Candidatus Syntrophocurvum alkaliphilum TaxID=2293317 RepID=A0A6I6D8U7_9FIRM|nr:hypothetical protein [Candidatus Syntrophocurvum alkaliphilum]QGT99368.1 hypothetical protein SYNTR_0775 [Candidatus Syntrophocurvum alkaliphilum]
MLYTISKLLTVGLLRSHIIYLPLAYFATILPISAAFVIAYGLLPALIGGAIYIVSTFAFITFIIHLCSFFFIDLQLAAILAILILGALFLTWSGASFRINYEAEFKRIHLHYISRAAITFLLFWLSNKVFDFEITSKTRFLELRLKNYNVAATNKEGKQKMAKEFYTDLIRLTELIGNDVIIYGFSAGSFEKILIEAGLDKSQITVYKAAIPSHHSLIYGKFERNFYIHIFDLRNVNTVNDSSKRNNNISPLRPIK